MATVELTKDNFVETVNDNDIVVVDFWASWCPPCRQFGPIFERASDRNGDVLFGKVNTEEQRELQAAYEIASIPTTLFIRDSVLVHQQVGVMNGDQLDKMLNQLRGLDMAEIHAAAEKPA
ncbi:MAG: thioredoxin [Micromonosporaceae bacterium]